MNMHSAPTPWSMFLPSSADARLQLTEQADDDAACAWLGYESAHPARLFLAEPGPPSGDPPSLTQSRKR